MTEEEFANVYLKTLIKKYPTVTFELTPDLTITSKKGDVKYQHYLNNAFTAYKAQPDSLYDIINGYVASTTDLYVHKAVINAVNIVPVIKPIEYLDELKTLNKDGKSFPLITEKYNNQLIIAYAEDSKNSITYLNEVDFNVLSVSRDTLKSIALRNLEKIIPKVQRQGENGVYMITAGGVYEASLILLSSIWTKENFPVDGEFIVGIPNRDMLMVTGSKNKIGINKIKEIVAESYKTGNYQTSEYLYKWTGRRFEKYN